MTRPYPWDVHGLRVLLFAIVLTPAALAAQAPAKPVTVTYGSADSEQKMDLYVTGSNAAATVLFIHGGSLQQSGERRTSSMYRDVCTPFVRVGITCATMDYRLAPKHRWPAMPNDVASAVRAIRRFETEQKSPPSHIFLFGHSSGCHLAAVTATNPEYLASADLKTTDIAGVIAMGCLLDRDDATLRSLTAERIRTPFMGESQDVATYGSPENYLAASPASFIGPHVPPTLVLLADAERFMPPIAEQGARFVRRLLEHGVAADMVIVPGDHVSSIQNLSAPDDPAFAAIKRFIANPKGSAAIH